MDKMIVFNSNIERVKGWVDLSQEERTTAKREHRALSEARQKLSKAELEAGRHVFKLHEVLAPKGLFEAYLEFVGIDRRTGFRWKDNYKFVSGLMPNSMVDLAIKNNVNIYGKEYTSVMKELPPPQTDNTEQQEKYLVKLRSAVSGARRERHDRGAIRKNREELMKEMVRFCRLRVLKIRKSERINSVCELASMLLAEFGEQSKQTVEPQPIPEGFIIPVGRPRKEAVEPNSAA